MIVELENLTKISGNIYTTQVFNKYKINLYRNSVERNYIWANKAIAFKFIRPGVLTIESDVIAL